MLTIVSIYNQQTRQSTVFLVKPKILQLICKFPAIGGTLGFIIRLIKDSWKFSVACSSKRMPLMSKTKYFDALVSVD